MHARLGANLLVSSKALVVAILFFAFPILLRAEVSSGRVFLRDGFTVHNKQELVDRLRRITGWPTLTFDANGTLLVGEAPAKGGSERTRDLLQEVLGSGQIVVLEDASRRLDVVFCQVMPGRWLGGNAGKPEAHVIQIDFDDFRQVFGDRKAREAFDVGWGLLHELDHVVHDSEDSAHLGVAGACESNINAMRRELGLPERVEYFFTAFPGAETDFKSRYVRLAFEQRVNSANKKRRYWLVWDGTIVGGVPGSMQVASIR